VLLQNVECGEVAMETVRFFLKHYPAGAAGLSVYIIAGDIISTLALFAQWSRG
jgi:hypothetical protein